MVSMATWTVSLALRMPAVEAVSFPLFPSLTELPLGPEFLYGFGCQARAPSTASHLIPSSRPMVYPQGLEAASRQLEIPNPSHRRYIQTGEWGSWAPRKKQGDRGVTSTTSNWSGSPDASPSRGVVAATNQTRRPRPRHDGLCRGHVLLWTRWFPCLLRQLSSRCEPTRRQQWLTLAAPRLTSPKASSRPTFDPFCPPQIPMNRPRPRLHPCQAPQASPRGPLPPLRHAHRAANAKPKSVFSSLRA